MALSSISQILVSSFFSNSDTVLSNDVHVNSGLVAIHRILVSLEKWVVVMVVV